MNIKEFGEGRITREKFLRTCGTVFAGGCICVVSAVLGRRVYAGKDKPKIGCFDCSGCTANCSL